jgi:hypothetical protein
MKHTDMIVDEHKSQDAPLHNNEAASSHTGLTLDVLPEVTTSALADKSNIGASTRNVSTVSLDKTSAHWFALRATYGREKKAYDFITSKGIVAFCPTVTSIKLINGKRKMVEESRLPNIFFAYGKEEDIKYWVYDNIHLPYLRFYYRHIHHGNQIGKTPLIVPDHQIDHLRIICEAASNDIIISTKEVDKFSKGQLVQVIDGQFRGVIGRVARYQGQQRVGIIIDGLFTIATAYVPSAFIKAI